MSIQSMTEIDGVNLILSAVSQSPISSLVAPLTGTVALAKNVLDEVKREVLSDGWAFNSDYEFPLSPDAISNQIAISESVLRIDGSKGKNGSKDLTQRQGLLYDKKERSYVFTSDVYVDVVYNQDFIELPDIARNYIAKRAATVLSDRLFNDGTQHNILKQAEVEALQRLKRHESDVVDNNMLSGSWSVARMLSRRNPFNR